jgi:AcrR family transcriptional regulator
MPRPSQEDKILEAALECFAEKGYDGTRIRQIAERAEVTEGALYRHYASKEEVAKALFKYHLGRFSAALHQTATASLPVEERLRAMIRGGLQLYRESRAAFNFVLLRPPGFNPDLPADFLYPVEAVEILVKEGQQAGIIRAGQPNVVAAIFLGCLLRPIIVSEGAAPGALDLFNETRHDQLIEDAAIDALTTRHQWG